MRGAANPEARARSHALDALRGAAIVSMLAANLAGPCLSPPHPLWLRAYGSFAAPTFVFLAGMMTSLGRRPAPLARLLKRSLLLLSLAVGIDLVCWGVAPFETFDVLYLLAFALPLAGASARLSPWLQALLAALVVLFTPWLQGRLGYGPLLPDHRAHPWPAWRSWLIDGWFPVFPWLGVALAGAAFGRLDPLLPERKRWLAPAGGLLVLLGGLAWLIDPPTIVTRMGYSELFYPPSLPYLALALGSVLLMLFALHAVERRLSLGWLALLGRSSLLLYAAHVALIALVLDERLEKQALPPYLAVYVTLTLALLGLAWGSERAQRWRELARERRASAQRA